MDKQTGTQAAVFYINDAIALVHDGFSGPAEVLKQLKEVLAFCASGSNGDWFDFGSFTLEFVPSSATGDYFDFAELADSLLEAAKTILAVYEFDEFAESFFAAKQQWLGDVQRTPKVAVYLGHFKSYMVVDQSLLAEPLSLQSFSGRDIAAEEAVLRLMSQLLTAINPQIKLEKFDLLPDLQEATSLEQLTPELEQSIVQGLLICDGTIQP